MYKQVAEVYLNSNALNESNAATFGISANYLNDFEMLAEVFKRCIYIACLMYNTPLTKIL